MTRAQLGPKNRLCFQTLILLSPLIVPQPPPADGKLTPSLRCRKHENPCKSARGSARHDDMVAVTATALIDGRYNLISRAVILRHVRRPDLAMRTLVR
jgi:hypothetical protein